MAINKKVKANIVRQINRCLFKGEGGRARLPDLQKNTSQISRATFYRWVNKSIKNPPKWVVEETKTELLKRAKKRSPRTTVKTAAKKLKEALPITPCAATVATVGIETLDFLLEMEKLYQDVYLARGKAVKTNPDGTEEVRNPKLLLETIKTRKSLMDTLIESQKLLLDMNRMAQLHNMILDTVAELAPDVFEVIVDKLKILDSEMGFTLH